MTNTSLCASTTTLVMASGTEFVKIFTVDKSTGEVVSLAQLLGNDPARLEAVSDNIKSQMIAQMAADDSISYFYQTDTRRRISRG